MLLLCYCCWRRRFSLVSLPCPTTGSALTMHLFTGLAVLQHSAGKLILTLFTVCSFMTDIGTHSVSIAQPIGPEFYTAGKCGREEDKADSATDLSGSFQVPERWLKLHFAMLMDGSLKARLELGSSCHQRGEIEWKAIKNWVCCSCSHWEICCSWCSLKLARRYFQQICSFFFFLLIFELL